MSKIKQQLSIDSALNSGYELSFNSYGLLVFTQKKNDMFYLRTLSGRASKFRNNYFFRTIEIMNKHIGNLIERAKSNFDYKEKRKAEKKTFVHSAEVGTIFYSSWGYEQTNVYFFQVVELIGKSTAIIKRIAGSRVEGTEGFDCCNVTAVKDAFLENEEPKKVRIGLGNTINLSSFESAWLWDGKPKYKSWYY